MFRLCLIKDGIVFPLFCLTNPAQDADPEPNSQYWLLFDKQNTAASCVSRCMILKIVTSMNKCSDRIGEQFLQKVKSFFSWKILNLASF
jgi:hypothetical protein